MFKGTLGRLMIGDWGDQLDVRFHLAERLARLNGKRVLDIACGPGLLLAALPDSNEKYGIDTNPAVLKKARQLNPRASLKRASMFRLPFESGFFDVIVMANVMPNVDFDCTGNARTNQLKAIGEAVRGLKPGGILFVTAPTAVWFGLFRAKGKKRLEYADLDQLLKPSFTYEIKGWNPLPPFPYFLPARFLKRIPGWFVFLEWLCEKGFFNKWGKFFYTEAVKTVKHKCKG